MLSILNKYGFLGFFTTLVLFVYLQGATNLIKEPKLRRALDEVDTPELSLKSFLSENFQQQTNAFARRNFGFFNSAFLEYNQLDYSLFKKPHAKNVLIGKQNFLYEKDYIEAYYGQDLSTDSLVENKVQKLSLIRNYLDSIGTKLFVVFAPGKASFYPEFIPDVYKADIPKLTNNLKYEKAFNKHSIPYINMKDWFIQMKDTATYPLISQTGIHWSYYGMLLAADSIITYSEKLLQKEIPNIYWTHMGQSNRAKDTDNDIEKGMNMFYPINEQILAYPNYNYEKVDFDIVKAIMVGDSYGLGLYKRGLMNRAFRQSEFWFYNQMIYKVGKHRKRLKYTNWLERLKSADVVFIVSTEATLRKFAYGFIEDVFFEVYPKHVLNKSKKKVVDEWVSFLKSDTTELKRIKDKASSKGITFDKALKLEGIYYYIKHYKERNH